MTENKGNMGKTGLIGKAKAWLESRMAFFIVILVGIQPLLDVLSYFLNLRGSTSISTLLRFGLLAVVALLGFFLSDAKRIYLILFGVVGLFWAAHAANCWRVGYTSFVQDTGNLLRMLNFPIYVLTFVTILHKDPGLRRWFFLGTAIAFGGIVAFTALPWLTGHPVYTYEAIQVGVLGWFAIPSAQSAIIVLAAPLMIYWTYQSGRYPLYLAGTVFALGLMFVTGTKLNFYSIFITGAAYIFLFVLQLGKKSVKYVLPLVLLLGLTVVFRSQSPMSVREGMTAYSQGIYTSMLEESLEDSGADESVREMIHSGGEVEEEEEKPVPPVEKRLEMMRRALMGIYGDQGVYGPLLASLNQRFGVYNVMQEYSHTDGSGILSNTRERKLNHCRLTWEEKDLPTRLLGFEYSDFLCGPENYDPENDFPAVFYNMGYVGFVLYLGFLGVFVVQILRAFFQNQQAGWRAVGAGRKTGVKSWVQGFWRGLQLFLTVETGAVGMSFLLALLAAQISGNVLRRPNVTIYFAISAAILFTGAALDQAGRAQGKHRLQKDGR